MVVPIGATTTFWPAATLDAPQTIWSVCPFPVVTLVIFSLSASGCFSQLSTSPTTRPFKPPGNDSNGCKDSTSRPMEVSIALNFSGLMVTGRYSLSQLYEMIMNAYYFSVTNIVNQPPTHQKKPWMRVPQMLIHSFEFYNTPWQG